jgi:hypothetical protein
MNAVLLPLAVLDARAGERESPERQSEIAKRDVEVA